MRVVIVGGGPAGAACALSLLRGRRRAGQRVEVLVLEPKQFGRHYNQCAGVLMPDRAEAILHEFGAELPAHLMQRKLRSYVLHTDADQITLAPDDDCAASYATRRVLLDEHFLNAAVEAGAEVQPDRMTDLEFADDGVVVYTDAGTHYADVVVGAFGLDPGAGAIFARRAGYRVPPCIDTLVTKLHPAGLEPIDDLLREQIHAFLPRLPRIEFGSLVPKGNHISIIIAGRGVTERDMGRFLDMPAVSRLLPDSAQRGHCFRGAFPVGLARRYCGHRYLMAGDATGLVRPFKGGGITTGLRTGAAVGRSLLEHGPSPQAAAAYMATTRDLRADIRYGKLLRSLVWLLSGPLSFEPVVEVARSTPAMRRVLYDCVSGRTSYRHIFTEELTAGLVARIASRYVVRGLRVTRSEPPRDA